MTTPKQKNFWKEEGTNERTRTQNDERKNDDMKKKKKKKKTDAPKSKLTHTMTTLPSEKIKKNQKIKKNK